MRITQTARRPSIGFAGPVFATCEKHGSGREGGQPQKQVGHRRVSRAFDSTPSPPVLPGKRQKRIPSKVFPMSIETDGSAEGGQTSGRRCAGTKRERNICTLSGLPTSTRRQLRQVNTSNVDNKDITSWLNSSKLFESLSDFALLAAVSALRDPNTGRYSHQVLSSRFPTEQVDRELRVFHAAAFRRWLSLPVSKKKDDIAMYLTEQSAPTATVVRVWRNLETYRQLLPEFASNIEKELFISDVKTVLALLDRHAEISTRQTLTQRERQVLRLLGQGMTTKDIAVALEISQYTVAQHRKAIGQKLGIRSAAGLVAYAVTLNI